MCQSMVNIQSPTAEIRRGKKKEEEEEEEERNSMKILWSALLHRATIIIKETNTNCTNGNGNDKLSSVITWPFIMHFSSALIKLLSQ